MSGRLPIPVTAPARLNGRWSWGPPLVLDSVTSFAMIERNLTVSSEPGAVAAGGRPDVILTPYLYHLRVERTVGAFGRATQYRPRVPRGSDDYFQVDRRVCFRIFYLRGAVSPAVGATSLRKETHSVEKEVELSIFGHDASQW